MSVSFDRLLRLPPVFSLHDLTKETYLGPDSVMRLDSAKRFLNRMQHRGYLRSAGPRTGYYYNLIADPLADKNRQPEVASLLYPEAIVIGINVLHAYGWVTQIPRTVDIAVSAHRRSLCQIDGVELRPRTREWFAQQQENGAILRRGESPFAIDSLSPRAALDDARQMKDMWVPQPDDLFIPEDEEEGVQRIYHRALGSNARPRG